ncbi:MAG: hypothetical protein WKF84_21960 [Pyrinomonadaceae bacterium]
MQSGSAVSASTTSAHDACSRTAAAASSPQAIKARGGACSVHDRRCRVYRKRCWPSGGHGLEQHALTYVDRRFLLTATYDHYSPTACWYA